MTISAGSEVKILPLRFTEPFASFHLASKSVFDL
jgi:hypothetical protein